MYSSAHNHRVNAFISRNLSWVPLIDRSVEPRQPLIGVVRNHPENPDSPSVVNTALVALRSLTSRYR